MSEHIDLDVSGILKRELNLDKAGDKLINTTLRTANGRHTCAEALGHREFVMTYNLHSILLEFFVFLFGHLM